VENVGEEAVGSQGEPCCTIANCCQPKKNWNTKEDKGKSMLYALYILCGWPKAHLGALKKSTL